MADFEQPVALTRRVPRVERLQRPDSGGRRRRPGYGGEVCLADRGLGWILRQRCPCRCTLERCVVSPRQGAAEDVGCASALPVRGEDYAGGWPRRGEDVRMAAAGIEWMADPEVTTTGFCVTFAKDLTPTALLRRFGCAGELLGERTARETAGLMVAEDRTPLGEADAVIRAGLSGAWAFAVEGHSGWGLDPATVRAVSAGTESVTFFVGVTGRNMFVFAEDGTRTAFFEVGEPELVDALPERVRPALLASGLMLRGGAAAEFHDAPDYPELRLTLRMAHLAWGLDLSREAFDGPLLTGRRRWTPPVVPAGSP